MVPVGLQKIQKAKQKGKKFMAIKYVAIDSGKFATKAVTLKSDRTEKLLVFRTKMEETNRASVQGTSFLVEYEEKSIFLGNRRRSHLSGHPRRN